MSHRAIQRLRQERESQQPLNVTSNDGGGGSDDDEDDSNDDEDEYVNKPKTTIRAFAMVDDDDDDDDDSSDEEAEHEGNVDSDVDDGEEQSGADSGLVGKKPFQKRNLVAPAAMKSVVVDDGGGDDHDDDDSDGSLDTEEDLDALLEEYKIHDGELGEATASSATSSGQRESSWYSVITQGIDARDLDIDYVMRTSLLGSSEGNYVPRSTTRRGNRHAVFGPPRDNWPRPPHYVGGGMGMTTYDENVRTHPASPPLSDGDLSGVGTMRSLPWPYNTMKLTDERCPNLDKWFKYTYSDNYERDCQDFEAIRASGDANALAMFVAHHPFVVEALLQLSAVLYQTSQSQEGLSLLKRALWVLECASLNSFLTVEGRIGLMDFDLNENRHFFNALFRLVRVSYVAGLTRASLAVSRFLLSLDPLRDPMNVLVAIDHFALLCNTDTCNNWITRFVESQKVYVTYCDDENPDGFKCPLLDLPNWAFSYALAIFRLYESNPTEETKAKADGAIRTALCKFPTVVGQILERNEINVNGRSFQTDWPSVLTFVDILVSQSQHVLSDAAKSDPVIRACTSQACETMVRIFVQQNYKLWSSVSVLKWVYDNLQHLKESNVGKEDTLAVPLSPAIMRYARCDPSDYEDKVQTMPVDANPLDRNAVALALVVDVNRPRLLQRMPRGGDADRFGQQPEIAFGAGNGFMIAGPPTQNIDPDLPLLEVFWRSALPWNHVEGVPPPAR